ncbi:MAG TPA: AAA family ATPase [Sedimentisphaerales bacterium]|nr:AAA family ATPase [Sedimentisphaerales bacterium]
MTTDVKQIGALVEQKSAFVRALFAEMDKVIVGQRYMLERMLIGLLANGHILLEGVPGLAKTMAVTVLARAIHADFRRIQFTPDLLPADLIGTQIYRQSDGEFYTRKGPIFANIILADEINRAPAKVQSALLEAMQERQVSIGEESFPVPSPFLVLATQNPIEQEGTYPLPKLEQDRFMFSSIIDHLPRAEEIEVVNMTTSTYVPDVKTIMAGEELLQYHEIVREIPVSEPVIRYAVRLAASSRPGANGTSPDFVEEFVSWGASIRGSHYLVLAAKALAILDGRFNVGFEDIQAVAMPVLRHRITTNFRAESLGLKPEDIITRLIETIEPPAADL